MFNDTDNSPEARRWRIAQMIANTAIEGVETDPELVAIIEQGHDDGLSQDEIAARLIERFKGEQNV